MTKEIDLTDTTIKLFANSDHVRANLFDTLIRLRPIYTLVGDINPKTSEDAYFHIFFNFSSFDKPEDMIMKMSELQDNEILTILDISDNNLLVDPSTASVTAVAAIFASYVTCSTAEIQEQVYDHTGRLSTIVEWPLFKEDFTKPLVLDTKKPNILWYGLNSEIFSIRPYTLSTGFEITTYFESKDNRNWKSWKRHINEADLIFLPKTFTEEDELIRVNKVEECVRLGKFVIAPALNTSDTLCIDFDLNEATNILIKNPSKVKKIIKENQKALKRLYDPESSADQLIQALRIAPNDEFAQNLDFSDTLIEGK